MAVADPELDAPGAVDDTPGDPAADGWRGPNKKGQWYVPARGRSGTVIRQGTESVEEALAADEANRDKPKYDRPRKKPPAATKQPKPTTVSSIELEAMLTEVLKSPAMGVASIGDDWAFEHFITQAPVLSRNLVKASEHNPWLRSKLEAIVLGGNPFVKLIAVMPVFAALVAYAVPPIIYYFDPPFIPRDARDMFGIPDRQKPKPPEGGVRDASPPSAETPAAAGATAAA